jgi:3-phenylpropionate/trans-cinnamate dioxygenase ferredoxin subunit
LIANRLSRNVKEAPLSFATIDAMEQETWVRVGTAADLAENKRIYAFREGIPILVIRDGDRLHAMEDGCPHAGASFFRCSADAGHIQCPAHGLRFRLSDGGLAGSAACSPSMSLRMRAVREHDGSIEVGAAVSQGLDSFQPGPGSN